MFFKCLFVKNNGTIVNSCRSSRNSNSNDTQYFLLMFVSSRMPVGSLIEMPHYANNLNGKYTANQSPSFTHMRRQIVRMFASQMTM